MSRCWPKSHSTCGGLILLDYTANATSISYLEHSAGIVGYQLPLEVRRHRREFERMRSLAWSPEETQASTRDKDSRAVNMQQTHWRSLRTPNTHPEGDYARSRSVGSGRRRPRHQSPRSRPHRGLPAAWCAFLTALRK
ncbi:Scr1 family TA system antitoxin-like transcriptional regulator [Yinghuangia aomiensis]